MNIRPKIPIYQGGSTLDLDKVQELIEQFGNKLQTENSEIMAQIDALNLGELFKQ